MSIDTTTLPPFSHNGKAPVAIHTVYLALGSNMGDRRSNLAAALQRLRHPRARVLVARLPAFREAGIRIEGDLPVRRFRQHVRPSTD